jgi:hypothetical protein
VQEHNSNSFFYAQSERIEFHAEFMAAYEAVGRAPLPPSRLAAAKEQENKPAVNV